MSYDDMPQKQARIEALREEKGRLQKVRQTNDPFFQHGLVPLSKANLYSFIIKPVRSGCNESGTSKKSSSPTDGTADSAGRGGEIQYQRCRKSS